MRWHEQRFNEAMRELDEACFTRAIGRDEYRRRRRVLLDTWTDPSSASDIDSAHNASLDALVEAHTHGRDTVRRAVPHAVPLTASHATSHAVTHASSHAAPRSVAHTVPYSEYHHAAAREGAAMPRANTSLKHASRSGHFGGRTLALWAAVAAVAFASALAYWLM